VCGRASARSAARLADALTEAIRNPQTPIEVLPPLVQALGAAGGRLPHGEASPRANTVIAVLAGFRSTRTKPRDRVVLAEAMAAAWPGVSPTEASAHVRRTVADLEDLVREPKSTLPELNRLTRALGVVYRYLGAAERAALPNTLLASHANTLLAVLRNPRYKSDMAARVQFADALLALCMILDPPEAMRVFDALLPVLSDLDVHGFLLNTVAFQRDPRVGPIKNVFSRWDEADLRRLLEHPLAVGTLSRIVLDALGESKQCSFRNKWDYLDRIASHENATGVPSARPND
jgi:hypothetical protein